MRKCLRAPIVFELSSTLMNTNGQYLQEEAEEKTGFHCFYFTVFLKDLRVIHIHLPLHPSFSLWREGTCLFSALKSR